MPTFVGNTIRGALGRALFRECCRWKEPRCGICGDVAGCAYGAMYKAHGDVSVPNPYVVSAPYPSTGNYKAGATLDFYITLFGSACAYEEKVFHAARSMCEGKLRDAVLADEGRLYITEWSDSGVETIAPCEALIIDFISPTVIQRSGEVIMEIDFPHLMDSLFGRIAGIIDNYTDGEFVLPYHLLERKPFVRSDYDLRQVRFKTSSQPIDGVLGRIRYFGDVTRYLPYIDLGSQLQIGKKTTRGCGEYRINISSV